MSLRQLFKEACSCKDKKMMHSDDEVNETAPPAMEDWILKNKEKFKEKYGNDWQKMLYSTAWKIKNKSEKTVTGDVAPTHYPVGYDDEEDKKKIKEVDDWDKIFGEYKEKIKEILTTQDG